MIIPELALALAAQKAQDVTVVTSVEKGLVIHTERPAFPTTTEISNGCQARPQCAQAVAEAALEADRAQTAARLMPQGTYGNNYSWGNCTAYVASRIAVPNSLGNANNWLYGLLAAGYRGGEARRGAIAQTSAGWAGHVAVVEAVQGNMVLVSEMNYSGLGVVDFRWTNITDWNYIYL